MYPPSTSAYDRATTVFSPDGRLFQVEYAKKAVEKGTTAVGLIYKDGGLIATDKLIRSKLVNVRSIEKIFKIDEHIGAVASGLVADARKLIDHARVTAQREKVIYGEPIPVEMLTRDICDLKQSYTQYGGTRPFGVSLLILGADSNGAKLFETDPSGAFSEVYATAIGQGKKVAEDIFEEKYVRDMKFDDAVKLAVDVLAEVNKDEETSDESLEIYYVSNKERKFTKLDNTRIQKSGKGRRKK
jgi:proteasome alpha subunit